MTGVGMTAPLIGVVGRRKKGAKIGGMVSAFADVDIDLYIADYARSVIAAGGLPVHLPIDIDPASIVDRLDGVLLTGGADVDPTRYGADADPEAGPFEAQRDALELAVLDRALDRELPVLGICRGMQLLNIHTGGTLHQHVPEHAFFDTDPTELVHQVSVTAGTRLAELYDDRIAVNSLHHQTVDRLGAGLVVSAVGDDDVIEAVEMPGRDVLAVQWHPELFTPVEPVFRWLVTRSRSAK
jgi:putative glutamine amidotransferase